MGAVSLNTNCDLKHPISKDNRANCKAIKRCISQTCSQLQSINPTLYDGCTKYCQGNPKVTSEDYVCKIVGADVLYNNFGLIRCGYDPKTSAQYQAFDEIKKANAEVNTNTESNNPTVTIVLVALIALSLWYLFFKILK